MQLRQAVYHAESREHSDTAGTESMGSTQAVLSFILETMKELSGTINPIDIHINKTVETSEAKDYQG